MWKCHVDMTWHDMKCGKWSTQKCSWTYKMSLRMLMTIPWSVPWNKRSQSNKNKFRRVGLLLFTPNRGQIPLERGKTLGEQCLLISNITVCCLPPPSRAFHKEKSSFKHWQDQDHWCVCFAHWQPAILDFHHAVNLRTWEWSGTTDGLWEDGQGTSE